MGPLVAIALATNAFASDPPVYNPDADVRSLRAASSAVMQAVNVVLPQPVQPDRLATIKGGLDDVARQCAAADGSARSIVAQTDPPLAWMNKMVKGGGDAIGADARAVKAAASAASSRRRWQDATALADQLRTALHQPEADRDRDKPRKLAALEDIRGWLAQADGSLRQAEETLPSLDSPKSEIKSREFSSRELRFELDKAGGELSRHAATAARASSDAKAAVDAFKEGDNATQAKAYQTIGETLDAGKNVSNYSSVVASSAGWFGERYSAALKAQAKLDEIYKAQVKSLGDAEGPLAAAEQALANSSR